VIDADPEHGAIRIGGRDRAQAAIFRPGIVGGKRSGRPDHAAFVVGPARHHILADFVDGDDSAAIVIVSGHDAADFQRHSLSPDGFMPRRRAHAGCILTRVITA
jgi:hypothetical protein